MACGAAGAALATALGSFSLLLVAMALFGFGASADSMSRYAAADVHPAHRRGAAIAFVVWAGTIGSVLGPTLLSPCRGSWQGPRNRTPRRGLHRRRMPGSRRPCGDRGLSPARPARLCGSRGIKSPGRRARPGICDCPDGTHRALGRTGGDGAHHGDDPHPRPALRSFAGNGGGDHRRTPSGCSPSPRSPGWSPIGSEGFP